MFNNKGFILAALFLALVCAYVLLKPKPIKIETTPPQSRYSQCCRLHSGEASCVDQAGADITYSGVVPIGELSLCLNNDKPTNKVDFSRHQILSPSDVLASADCCAVTEHSKRCTLANGQNFEMPLAKTETQLQACE